MKIVHLCLSCFYIDGYNYQENIIPKINQEDGNEVKIIASTETFVDNRELGYLNPSSYYTETNIPIVRLPYVNLGVNVITRKLRVYKGLYNELETFSPDVIMSHDVSFFSIIDVVKYVKRHKDVKLYADSHTTYENSGRNWLSLNVLHKGIYKSLVKLVVPYLKTFLYIGPEEKRFLTEVYKVPNDLMEHYPLGGIVLDDDEYLKRRVSKRNELKISNQEILIVHSGKITRNKSTDVLIKAFLNSNLSNAKLVIIGTISNDKFGNELKQLIDGNEQIQFLGWKPSDELYSYLCACDLYCQPGTPSATLQNAICCNCAILTKSYSIYEELNIGNFMWASSYEDLMNCFIQIKNGEVNLCDMQLLSKKLATEVLDYKKLAAKLYE